MQFRCAACREVGHSILIKLDLGAQYITKVGQEPPWNISIDKDLERALGSSADLFNRGKTCEGLSYGIGAYCYYRRVVEDTFDELIGQITDLVSDNERQHYLEQVAEAQREKKIAAKIKLIQPYLPSVLCVEGNNPLETLYKTLSEGIHGKNDEGVHPIRIRH